MHVWDQGQLHNTNQNSDSSEYTVDFENDWAFACPLGGGACQGWGIYVAGKNRNYVTPLDSDSGTSQQQGDIKFTELCGSMLANVLQLRRLERQQSSLRNFFSPIVLEAFSDQDPDIALAPRECEVSVLFCDLRGFAKTSEKMAHNLQLLLNRVSDALGIMTRNILELDGVVGDFHGDAAMGFWGWPFAIENTALSACLAALAIQKELNEIARDPGHPLQNFQMGVGVATGTAVAGKIGTNDQVKVTAFGPVVNLAARLEGMTRLFGSSVLLDKSTYDLLSSEHAFKLRKLFQVLPYGLESPATVYQLFTPNDDLESGHLDAFASGLEYFESGDWVSAIKQFSSLSQHDSGIEFLISYMKQWGEPPNDWQGVVSLKTK